MKTFNNKIFIGFFVVIILGALVVSSKSNLSKKDVLTIGVLQTISHPALDAARDGAVSRLKELLGDKVCIITQNAEGSAMTAQNIAASFHNNKQISAVITIATLATQAMAKVEKEKPIIYCAVTDPKALGLVHDKTNACGITDAVDINQLVKRIKMLLPTAKNIALLFNPAETNSVSFVNEMDAILQLLDIKSFHVGVNNECEVSSAATVAFEKADAVVIPTDNTIASVMSVVAKAALKNNKPLFICDDLLFTNGVFGCTGSVNYHEAGRQSADLIMDIVNHEKTPETILAVGPALKKMIVSQKMADALNIKIADTLKNDIEIRK